jgi:hypothetical protein
LHLDIYYPENNNLTLNVRINDYYHLKNNRYEDRFNKKIALMNGWNHIIIPIDDIASAPKGRMTNLENVQSLGMFVTNLDQPETIYIDNVYLD